MFTIPSDVVQPPVYLELVLANSDITSLGWRIGLLGKNGDRKMSAESADATIEHPECTRYGWFGTE